MYLFRSAISVTKQALSYTWYPHISHALSCQDVLPHCRTGVTTVYNTYCIMSATCKYGVTMRWIRSQLDYSHNPLHISHHTDFSSSISSTQIYAAMGCHCQSHFFYWKRKVPQLIEYVFLHIHVRSSNPVKNNMSSVTYDGDNTRAHLCWEGNKMLRSATPSSIHPAYSRTLFDNCLQTHFLYFEKSRRWGLRQKQTEN